MNLFELKEYNSECLVYLYRPEGRGDWGEVLYSFADGAARIEKRAGENSSWHDNHAISKVEECVNKNNLPIKFTQAWY